MDASEPMDPKLDIRDFLEGLDPRQFVFVKADENETILPASDEEKEQGAVTKILTLNPGSIIGFRRNFGKDQTYELPDGTAYADVRVVAIEFYGMPPNGSELVAGSVSPHIPAGFPHALIVAEGKGPVKIYVSELLTGDPDLDEYQENYPELLKNDQSIGETHLEPVP